MTWLYLLLVVCVLTEAPAKARASYRAARWAWLARAERRLP